jgi:pimeloyl-ACP methyl ester carboxylesterase
MTVAFAEGETTAIAFGPEGPPDLVFLHATGFNARTYRTILEPLGRRFRVVAIDQRGHGRCRLAARPQSLRSWGDYVRDFLSLAEPSWKGAPPPVIAGHSMGGAVALMAAARRPGLAERLVLLDPVIPRGGPLALLLWLLPLSQRIAHIPISSAAMRRRDRFPSREAAVASYRGRGAFRTWQGPFLDDYVEDGFAPTGAGEIRLTCAPHWEAATYAGLRIDVASAARTVRCPVDVLVPERGSALRIGARRLRMLNPDLRIETLPGTSHFLPMEVPAVVRERLEQALEARRA